MTIYSSNTVVIQAIQAVWRQLTRAHVEGYLDHFGSFMAQYAAMVQTPLSECLERLVGGYRRILNVQFIANCQWNAL